MYTQLQPCISSIPLPWNSSSYQSLNFFLIFSLLVCFQYFNKKKKSSLIQTLHKIKSGNKNNRQDRMHFVCIYIYSSIFFMLITKLYMHVKVQCVSLCLDLMMLGFMSLILTVSEKRISNICIPKSMAETFLPCGTMDSDDYSEEELKCLEQVINYPMI